MKSLEQVKAIQEKALKESLNVILEVELVATMDETVAKTKNPYDDIAWATFKNEVVSSLQNKIAGIKL